MFGSLIIILPTKITPIYQIALLIVLYFIGGILITYFDFYFIGLTYIIIYVGAIAILFIFLIMMIVDNNPNIYMTNTNTNKNILLSTSLLPITLLLIYNLYISLYHVIQFRIISKFMITNWYKNYITLTDINALSIILFNGYHVAILLIGIILLTVLIGILDLKS